MNAQRKIRMLVSAGAVLPLTIFGMASASSAAPASSSARVALPGTSPSWVAKAKQLATPDVATSMTVRVYLAPEGGLAGLQSAVTGVSTPGSSSYRHFLTPAQYRARFEPAGSAVSAVSSWLTSSGMTVTGVEASRRYVTATGSVAATQTAFGTSLRSYSHNGLTVLAPATTATAPANVGPDVLAVSGLDTTPELSTSGVASGSADASNADVSASNTDTAASGTAPASTNGFRPPAGFANARPCSAYYGQLQATTQADFSTPLPTFNGKNPDWAVCGYVPWQLRSAYEGPTTLDGTGVTVAIVDAYAAPTILSDANTYATRRGDAPFAAGQFTQNLPATFNVHAGCGGASGWFGEESLDVEAVHAMAPNANVRFYGATSCQDVDLTNALDRIVDENKASIVSNSYGDTDSGASTDVIAAYEQAFLQGSMQGISFMFSSGDDGDELAATGFLQSDYPASDPYITAVGGTSAAINGNGNLAFQTGWGTVKYTLSADGKSWNPGSFLYGSGGGFSTLFNRPAYQNAAVPAGSPAGRAVPDVSLDADPNTGMLIGETQRFPGSTNYGEYRIGGTSLSSPLMAGVQALADQHAGGRAGLLNPAIYSQVAKNKGTFTDVAPSSAHHNDANVRPDFINGVDATGGISYSVRAFDHDSSLSLAAGWDDVTGVGTPNAKYLTSFTPAPAS